MSYASVAAANAPPPHLQANPALLNTDPTANPPQQPEPLSDDHDEPKKKENPRLKEVKAEGLYLWHVAKHHLLQPGIAGGLIGVVSAVVLGAVGYISYVHTALDRRALSAATAVGLLALWGVDN
ncbi:hypothetical protein H0H92_012135 [Tricholoma furcatifolium]|nr:hypothetical protein H0H92_012135 [Tricholoma furcatifolium]